MKNVIDCFCRFVFQYIKYFVKSIAILIDKISSCLLLLNSVQTVLESFPFSGVHFDIAQTSFQTVVLSCQTLILGF